MNRATRSRLYGSRKRKSAKKSQARLEGRVQGAHAAASKLLLLAHGPCNDGIAAVALTKRALGSDGIGVIYIQPNKIAPVLRLLESMAPRNLLILDLSLDARQEDAILGSLQAMQSAGWTCSWRDHHAPQWKDAKLDEFRSVLEVLDLDLDQTESGASLQAKALPDLDDYGTRLAALVRDRDIWINDDPDSELLEHAGRAMKLDEMEAEFVNAPNDGPALTDSLRRVAEDVLAQNQADADLLLREAVIYRDDNILLVYGNLPTNIGLHQAIEQGHGLVASVRPNGRVSLRADPETPFAAAVAKKFGGGGHDCAAGLDLGLSGLKYWWYKQRHGRVPRVMELRDAMKEAFAA